MGNYEIEKIVREVFNDSGNDELSQLLIYYITPGVFKNTKREMLENVLYEKVKHINGNIRWSMKLDDIELIPFGTEEEKKLVNFLIEECFFETEKYTNYAVKLVKFGGGLFKSLMSVGMEGSSYYIMYKSFKRATTEFFIAIYTKKDY